MGIRSALQLGVFASTAGLLLSGLSACDSGELEGAKAEVMETSVELDLPAVPEFNMPSANADGTHPVTEMRLKGNKFLDTEVKVKGHVAWIYDCATAVRTPEMTEKELAKLLEEEPERCLRPHFVLVDQPGAPADKGIEVVEYPRPLRKDEKKALPDEMVRENQAALAALPHFEVGDEVVVTGTWTLKSEGGFRNSDGLLAFQSLENLSKPAE